MKFFLSSIVLCVYAYFFALFFCIMWIVFFFFRQSYWPNGVRADAKPPRDFETKNRTRVAAKVALLSCLSDELKHIIGSETTRRGLLLVFELFQMPVLNRRLLYVLFEGIIENLFPDNNLIIIIRKLYSKSPRVINNQQKINSWYYTIFFKYFI